MTISATPYLNFAGNTREAFEYYQEIFGGEVEIATLGDYGMEPADATMHASLTTPAFSLMASDAFDGAEKTWGGTRIYIALTGDDLDTLTGWFQRLAADGSVGQDLEMQVWGDYYGNLTDRFGIEWMFNISGPQTG